MKQTIGSRILLVAISIGFGMANVAGAAESYSIRSILQGLECANRKECEMVRRHIRRDNKACRVHPRHVAQLDRRFRDRGTRVIEGSISYIGFYPGRYHYRAFRNSRGQIVIDARVHVHSMPSSMPRAEKKFELELLNEKLREAAAYYTRNNPYRARVKFQFSLTRNKREATVSIALVNQRTRGPYFKEWSTLWPQHTINHEIGHLLGLDDEYNNVATFFGSSNPHAQCNIDSIMCAHFSERRNSLQKYHYYMIFRRLLCRQH